MDQLTVFVENSRGHLTGLCKALGDASINMHAFSLAETTDYGVARIICDDPQRAATVLTDAGYRATTTEVCVIKVPDTPGALTGVFEALEEAGCDVEYSYCFSSLDGAALNAIKCSKKGADALTAAGFETVEASDLA